MGCPKGFSLKGGMGAALLTQPEKVSRLEINILVDHIFKIQVQKVLKKFSGAGHPYKACGCGRQENSSDLQNQTSSRLAGQYN